MTHDAQLVKNVIDANFLLGVNRYDQERHDRAVLAADALLERIGNLRQLLTEALEILEQDIEDVGPCDHSVGLCICGITGCAERIKDALKEGEE